MRNIFVVLYFATNILRKTLRPTLIFFCAKRKRKAFFTLREEFIDSLKRVFRASHSQGFHGIEGRGFIGGVGSEYRAYRAGGYGGGYDKRDIYAERKSGDKAADP